MTTTANRRPWIVGAAIAIVAIAMIVVVAVWSQSSGGAKVVDVGSTASADRVDIEATVIRVDAASGELTLRLLVIPRGSLTTEAGLSPGEDHEILTSAAVKTDPFFPAGERIPTVDVAVVLGGTSITAYPFDRHTAPIELTARYGGRTVDVHLTLTNRDALFSASAEAFSESQTAIVDLELRRSGSVLTFAIFMIAAMWALAIAVATGAWFVVSRRRGLVWPALGWMAATLSAIAGFRNAAPGSPPIGSLIDYLAFFWAEAVIAVCVFTVVTVGVSVERTREE